MRWDINGIASEISRHLKFWEGKGYVTYAVYILIVFIVYMLFKG